MIEFVLRLLYSQSVDPFYESGNMHPYAPTPAMAGGIWSKTGADRVVCAEGMHWGLCGFS